MRFYEEGQEQLGCSFVDGIEVLIHLDCFKEAYGRKWIAGSEVVHSLLLLGLIQQSIVCPHCLLMVCIEGKTGSVFDISEL